MRELFNEYDMSLNYSLREHIAIFELYIVLISELHEIISNY